MEGKVVSNEEIEESESDEEEHEEIFTSKRVYKYARIGDINNLKVALAYGNNSIDWYRNKHGHTALHAAAYYGHSECIGVLLGAGIDIKDDGGAALRVAAQEGHTECIDVRLEIKNERRYTALLIATHQGHTACIDVLLDRGANIENKVEFGYTALHVAADRGHTECIGVLLDRGADIGSKNCVNGTALHTAAARGYASCVGLLLDRGADSGIKAFNGFTALHVAASEGHTECTDLLLDRGADIGSKDNEGNTALHAAADKSHIGCIGVLLDRGADIESKENQGRTALQRASFLGHTECIGLLLDRGADIESKDNRGSTSLTDAAVKGHIECISVLLDRGADIESGDVLSAVTLAAFQGYIQCTRLLLDRQAIIHEEILNNIPHPECKQMIRDETQHRLRRAAFDSFINHHIEYPPLIHNIYSTCYPSGDLRVASPAFLGWDRAEAVRNKYYFDEVLFYVHVNVASVFTRSLTKQSVDTDIAKSLATSQCREQLASSSDKTSTLMTVLSSYLKEFLTEQPRQFNLCGGCHRQGDLKCSRCKRVFYCSAACQRSDWRIHKSTCSSYTDH